MKTKTLIIVILLFLLLIGNTKAQQTNADYLGLMGPYLGQKPPGKMAEKFALGVITTDEHEFSCSFSPDGKEFYFSRTAKVSKIHSLLYTKLGEKGWSFPEKVNEYDSFEPFVSRDGKRLYFCSWKPLLGRDNPSLDIWYSTRKEDGWSEPQNLGHPFNPGKAMSVSETDDRVIYVTDLTNGFGEMGISRSAYFDGGYLDYEHLESPFNFGSGDMYPFIAPDESYIVYTSQHPSDLDGTGLFVAFRDKSGGWNTPLFIETGKKRNALPVITPDEKYLFFTSLGDIYWMDAGVLQDLKQKILK